MPRQRARRRRAVRSAGSGGLEGSWRAKAAESRGACNVGIARQGVAGTMMPLVGGCGHRAGGQRLSSLLSNENKVKCHINHRVALRPSRGGSLASTIFPIQYNTCYKCCSKLQDFVPHKNGVGTLWPNLNRLSRLVPCGKGDFTFTVKPGTL